MSFLTPWTTAPEDYQHHEDALKRSTTPAEHRALWLLVTALAAYEVSDGHDLMCKRLDKVREYIMEGKLRTIEEVAAAIFDEYFDHSQQEYFSKHHLRLLQGYEKDGLLVRE